LSSVPGKLPRYAPADADILCDKPAVRGDTIKGTTCTLGMQTASSSGMTVTVYQTTQCRRTLMTINWDFTAMKNSNVTIITAVVVITVAAIHFDLSECLCTLSTGN